MLPKPRLTSRFSTGRAKNSVFRSIDISVWTPRTHLSLRAGRHKRRIWLRPRPDVSYPGLTAPQPRPSPARAVRLRTWPNRCSSAYGSDQRHSIPSEGRCAPGWPRSPTAGRSITSVASRPVAGGSNDRSPGRLPTYGWPRDAVDAALVVLFNAGLVQARSGSTAVAMLLS